MSTRAGDTSLRRRFDQHLHSTGLLRDARHLLVAVSGGLDSLVLLHLLRFANTVREQSRRTPHEIVTPDAATGPFRLTAAHFDHAMRATSAGDARWLRGLCTAWQIPLLTERADTPPSGEAGARALRYAYLKKAADAVSADAILTAHHADDQAETVLFRIMRGTGITGLAGIAQRRGNIIRPLLPFLRSELLAYARAHHLQWREDETNRDLRYARNRIRHQVLPLLERTAPGITERLAQLAADAASEEQAWRTILEDVVQDVVTESRKAGFTLARDRLLAYHPHIRARVMRHLLQRLGCRIDRAATRGIVAFAAAGASGTGLALPGHVRFERDLDRLLLHRPEASGADDAPLLITGVEAGQAACSVGGRRLRLRWSMGANASGAAVADGSSARFDPSSLRFPLMVRGWRAGDRIRLGYGSKKLKKLFLERRLARARRARTPVLTDRDGTVLWVIGVAQAHGTGPAAGGAYFELTVVDGDSE